MSTCKVDWNSNEDFFNFTRGRFVVDEAENLRKRRIRFDMNQLACAAASSIGATQCVSIEKFTDGMYNKAFLMSMDDGRQVVAKVPNPNAGIPHLTTASEVASMDFARNVLDTPAPRVYSWNSRASSHPVGAEFIIMEKASGVPLGQVWETMKLPQKLQILLAITRLQKQWLSVTFSHYGSLYYAKDVQTPPKSFYIKDGQKFSDSPFSIGPAAGRNWSDAGRSDLECERGPWNSLANYMRAIGARETAAIHLLKPPKQIALFCGPGLYRPDAEKKLVALTYYQQLIDYLIPSDTAITVPHLWHNDLHDENIFVDPEDPGKVTGIIDWQSCHLSPLFHNNPDPSFLSYDGLEPETLDPPPKPDYTNLSEKDRMIARREYITQNVFIGWRQLMAAKNPALHRTVQFRKTAQYGLIFLAQRMYEYGEAHFLSLLVDLKDTWLTLPSVSNDKPFPFDFSKEEIERIKRDGDDAVAGTELVAEVRESLEDLWPDKGFIDHERYDEAKAVLRELKVALSKRLASNDEERDEFERFWPFDD